MVENQVLGRAEGGEKRVLFGALVPNSMDFSDGMIIVRCQRKRL